MKAFSDTNWKGDTNQLKKSQSQYDGERVEAATQERTTVNK